MSKERKPLRGKVARILTERQLVLNLGATKGVERGMVFKVIDPKGEDIKDPDTGEVLGSLGRLKVRVRVVDVKEEMSVASTYRSRRVNIGGTGDGMPDLSAFSRSLLPPRWVKEYETLSNEDRPWDEIEESQSFVKVGDPVIQVIDSTDGTHDADAEEA